MCNLKQRLIRAMQIPVTGNHEFIATRLQEKIGMCRELLQTLDVVEPGLSLSRGEERFPVKLPGTLALTKIYLLSLQLNFMALTSKAVRLPNLIIRQWKMKDFWFVMSSESSD